MECSRRKEWSVGGGRGIRLIESLVKTVGEQWEEERDGASEQSEEVMTRARMGFLLWVGKLTC